MLLGNRKFVPLKSTLKFPLLSVSEHAEERQSPAVAKP
jgi:hypothetical protein